jgi:hypothetical protein
MFAGRFSAIFTAQVGDGVMPWDEVISLLGGATAKVVSLAAVCLGGLAYVTSPGPDGR